MDLLCYISCTEYNSQQRKCDDGDEIRGIIMIICGGAPEDVTCRHIGKYIYLL